MGQFSPKTTLATLNRPPWRPQTAHTEQLSSPLTVVLNAKLDESNDSNWDYSRPIGSPPASMAKAWCFSIEGGLETHTVAGGKRAARWLQWPFKGNSRSWRQFAPIQRRCGQIHLSTWILLDREEGKSGAKSQKLSAGSKFFFLPSSAAYLWQLGPRALRMLIIQPRAVDGSSALIQCHFFGQAAERQKSKRLKFNWQTEAPK